METAPLSGYMAEGLDMIEAAIHLHAQQGQVFLGCRVPLLIDMVLRLQSEVPPG
jgi:hypothetical protein